MFVEFICLEVYLIGFQSQVVSFGGVEDDKTTLQRKRVLTFNVVFIFIYSQRKTSKISIKLSKRISPKVDEIKCQIRNFASYPKF